MKASGQTDAAPTIPELLAFALAGAEAAVYVDPEICLYDSLEPVWSALGEGGVALFPRLSALPEDGILVEDVTQMAFAARIAYPVYGPRTYISPGYQDNLGWGFATALGVQDAQPPAGGQQLGPVPQLPPPAPEWEAAGR